MSAIISRRASVGAVHRTCLPPTIRTGRRVISVRAEGSDNAQKNIVDPATSSPNATPSTPPEIPPPFDAVPVKLVSTEPPDLTTSMAFDGPVPEINNGRLAMLGFTAAVAAEVASGTPLREQLGGYLPPVLLTFVVLSVATVIPVLKGAKVKETTFFRPDAELLNGRLAMLGLVALGITEGIKGSALF